MNFRLSLISNSDQSIDFRLSIDRFFDDRPFNFRLSITSQLTDAKFSLKVRNKIVTE